MARARLESWVVPDAFWERVEPLIPPRPTRPARRKFARKPGGGRKPKDARLVFEAIVYVLRTGCQWKALPHKRFGSASTIHQRVSGVGEGRRVPGAVAGGIGRVRRHGGHRLALAEHRWGLAEGTAGARVGRAQPH